MTAPKPKVWMEHVNEYSLPTPSGPITMREHRRPQWSCDCGEPSGFSVPSVMDDRPLIERYIEAATKHSRTHTAERIAAHLKAEERAAEDELVHMWASACGYAADLIREHLVPTKETPCD